MAGMSGGAWSPEQGGYDRASTWENVHDDGLRADLVSYHSELMRLDECGPAADADRYVL